MFFMQALSEGGAPHTELLWLLGILVGFFALTIIVGWWAGARKPDQARAETEASRSGVESAGHAIESMEPKRSLKIGRRKK